MKFKRKIFILLSFVICFVVYQLNKRPVLGCFEKSKASLVSKYGFVTVEAEFKQKINQMWITSTHKDWKKAQSANRLNSLVIDEFITNCESYFFEVTVKENTKFLYDVVLYDVEKRKEGRTMMKSKKGKTYRISGEKGDGLVNYERK